MKRIIALMPLPLAIILRLLASSHPDVVETYYANGVYPALAAPVSRFLSFFPFPIIEIFIFVFAAGMLYLLLRKKFFIATSVCLLLPALVIGGWGLNYFRLPLEQTLGLRVRNSSVEELATLSAQLMRAANARYTTAPDDLLSPANDALNAASRRYPIPAGAYGSPKFALSSPLLSNFLIEGITSPFTMEALVNGDIPKVAIPFVASHEAAHLRGFAREEDANLIAYLACEASDNPYYRYSGAVNALMYTLDALGSVDPAACAAIYQIADDAVLADLRSHAAYWEPYHNTKTAQVGTHVNNAYLQTMASGNQSVQSYGRIVDLLLALSRKEEM